MKHEAINGPLSDSKKFIAHKKWHLKVIMQRKKKEYCDVDVKHKNFNQKNVPVFACQCQYTKYSLQERANYLRTCIKYFSVKIRSIT